MFNIFKKKNTSPKKFLKTDLHSHLLPQLDDGVESFSEALEIIKGLKSLGYNKIITTPHVMYDFYDNTPETILDQLKSLQKEIQENEIDIDLQASAEYYLDENLVEMVSKKPEKLLTFGDNYFLFETSFMNEPFYLQEFIFEAKSKGLNPIMAHPERYAYIHSDFSKIEDLINRGVLMQVNINSFSGYYSKEVKKTAEKLVDKGLVHFIGSDCHNLKHFAVMQKSVTEKYYKKALDLPLLNERL
ncbi:tyrosine-protein phosphatase [Fulvivirga sediminis]|uniref:protein-tyrosine-phosphatase n=1 Tax=Fulvivirga sediminis TaxID=2803949 RepID=A0A937F4I3_9BACT|nr:CpsB/CapC family capsule biosynthesis tyrosine phosphatase [Fulvivirga sediminis]MBL3656237.1 capsular biosynthesis protein [Fulvivirga sediminis]